MAFDAIGKLHVVNETKQVSERFSKREFVVEIADGKYPQFVLFQLTGDRCPLLDEHRVGDQVRVTFNVRGREWKSPQGETKYFNSLDVWKLEAASTGKRAGSNGGARNDDFAYRDDPRPTDLVGATRDDDLPF
jgi:hypothetical protein